MKKHLLFLIIFFPFVVLSQSYKCDIVYSYYDTDFSPSLFNVDFSKGEQSVQSGDNYKFGFKIEKGRSSTDNFSLFLILYDNDIKVYRSIIKGIEFNADYFEGAVEYGDHKYSCKCKKEN
ncbi:hypothetical protein C5O00_06875 [Pukyongia salina]|uniref:Uncharacterized protein n=1 Tax=Pukyongia salina TaxID=2094025 RepID=A0A2S0HW44_9FLAO|nr:hypothetical protein [Pukyongia salina]AVI50911.1 hypothetical protein C5O00_06875 [Pukyongia salina]